MSAPPTQRLIALVLAMFSVTVLALTLNLVAVSHLQHYTAQKWLYDELRVSLAAGSVPTGPLDPDGKLVEPGTPIALLSAPDIGLSREVIVEGTAGAQTMAGSGHRRDTALPCQVGTSVIMARAAAYGAAGRNYQELQPGDRFGVTMAQGSCTYEVIGPRRVGEQAPPVPSGREGRLTLTTADGPAFMPTEVYRVDARLVSDAFDRAPDRIPAGALPEAEQAMGIDLSVLFPLILLLQLMIAVAIGVAWMWRRWGRWQTWIVGIPPILAVGLLTATTINQWLLPNLL
ncbi:sortase domain-bontaining protein [Microbacterium sp. P04]|uniref:sortase domain-containing protein n=1 Tax=Microbacterium sp. P04 TaxID=3366947 RepID=UPI003745DD29